MTIDIKINREGAEKRLTCLREVTKEINEFVESDICKKMLLDIIKKRER